MRERGDPGVALRVVDLPTRAVELPAAVDTAVPIEDFARPVHEPTLSVVPVHVDDYAIQVVGMGIRPGRHDDVYGLTAEIRHLCFGCRRVLDGAAIGSLGEVASGRG